MANDIKKLLMDILICINNIESYLDQKNFADYDKNILIQDHVERNLITIGEAMNILLKKDPTISITNARKAVNTRNR